MKKIFVFIFFFIMLYNNRIISQDTLKTGILLIPKGQQRIVDHEVIFCDKLIMEDSSKLMVNGSSLKIIATLSELGDNCEVHAYGLNGNNGKDGHSPGEANRCNNGKPGGAGEVGGNGRSGKDFTLITRFENRFLLSVFTFGGQGGNGGRGGKGGKAGQKDAFRCGAKDGGKGGNGGNAGAGGDGGNIEIYYKDSGFAPVPGLHITMRSNGGAAGKPGAYGEGGGHHPGGSSGGRGNDGGSASNGKDGKTTIQIIKDECLDSNQDSYYALIIYEGYPSTNKKGEEKYEKVEENWVKTAEDLKICLESKFNFSRVEILSNPSVSDIQRKFNSYFTLRNKKLFIYMVGHSIDDNNSKYFKANQEEKLSYSEIINILNTTEVDDFLFIMQSCFSGNLSRSTDFESVVGYDINKSPISYCGFKSGNIITSGYSNQKTDNKFSEALLSKLNNSSDKAISIDELFHNIIEYTDFNDRPQLLRRKDRKDGSFIFLPKSN